MTAATQVRIRLEQEAGYAFRVQFPEAGLDDLLIDEVSPLGGDRGPDPGRLLLSSLGGCLAASLLFALRKYRNEPTEPLVVEISGQVMRNDEGRLRIPQVAVELHLPGNNADYQKLERILEQFQSFCTVTESVRQGIKVDVTVFDGDGRVLHGDKSFEAGA